MASQARSSSANARVSDPKGVPSSAINEEIRQHKLAIEKLNDEKKDLERQLAKARQARGELQEQLEATAHSK
jgi:chromosome segregation ATPase